MGKDRVLRFFFALLESFSAPDTGAGINKPQLLLCPSAVRTEAKVRRTLPCILILACLALSTLHAQTAAFAGDVTSLGGGFSTPYGAAVDAAGNVYVADTDNSLVKEIPLGCASSSCVTTLGGGFDYPTGVAVDASGNVYVADFLNNAVEEMPSGCASSSCVTPLGGGFSYPSGVAVDASGNIYVADYLNSVVKEMPPSCASSTCVTTLGGGFSYAFGVAVDASGNVYVADTGNSVVKEMTPACASSACVTMLGGGFNAPYGVAVDGHSRVYVADTSNSAVKEMPAGCASSACVAPLGFGFSFPWGVAASKGGIVYVADSDNNAVKEIQPQGVNFQTVAVGSTSSGRTLYFTFTTGGTGITASAVTQGATGLDFADAGTGSCDTNGSAHTYNAGDTCSVDVTFAPLSAGGRYGAVELLNGSSAVIATAYIYGTGQGPELQFQSSLATSLLGWGSSQPLSLAVDAAGNAYAGPNNGGLQEIPRGCASSSCLKALGGGFGYVFGVAVDGAGNVYLSDFYNGVKEMPPGCASSTCVTSLGGGFVYPRGVAVDGNGNIYIADSNNNAVKEMPPGCVSASCVTTLTSGSFTPNAITVDGSGNVFVTDLTYQVVRKFPSGCSSFGCSTALGGGFQYPQGVAVDGSGNIYIADTNNSAVKEMPVGCASSSCVTTLGSGFSSPYGVALDGSGNVYVADTAHNAVKEMTLATPPSLTFATTNVGSQSSDSPQTVRMANIGNAPLTFPVPGTGENPSVAANFTLDGSTTCPEVTTSSSAGTLASGATCNLAVDFVPGTIGRLTGSVVLTDNNLNAASVTQTIALAGNGASPLTPWVEVNNGAWQQVSSLTVAATDVVNMGTQDPGDGGSWSWTGPGGFTATTRVISGIPLTTPTNVFTSTYTNTGGVSSTQTFTVNVKPTAIVPWIQVNGGAWQQISTVTVNAGDTVSLGPQQLSGGAFSWTSPNGFNSTARIASSVPLKWPTNVFTLTYTNTAGVTSTEAFIVNVQATALTPWIQVNGGAWQQISSVAVHPGDTVNLGPQQLSGGSFSWSGPNGFAATTRIVSGVPLTSATNVFTLTYTNSGGGTSSETFTITVGSTPLTPWIQVNGGAWQQTSTATVNSGDTVNLGPQQLSSGTFTWSGPGGFTASTRVVSGVPLVSGANLFTLTYVNTYGGSSQQSFTITIGTGMAGTVQGGPAPMQQASGCASGGCERSQ